VDTRKYEKKIGGYMHNGYPTDMDTGI